MGNSPQLQRLLEVIVQDFTTSNGTPPSPPSATRSTFASLYTTVGVTRLPTPPSSFLHLMSLRTSNLLPPRPSIRRQSIAAHPRATNVSASSVTCYLWTYRRRYSRSVQDPKLLWQLEQARFDSSANLRDHEGYSRLFRGTVRFLFLSWYLLDPHKRWFKPHLYYLQVDVGPRIPH